MHAELYRTRKRWYESAWPGASFWRGASDSLPLTNYITYPAVSLRQWSVCQFLDPLAIFVEQPAAI
ncbi:protein fem-1 homolog B-like [Drosophila grimshawi]|uniref:protein fem-1 homolog B-like n=1 Tax=Drosophila grimshawi TaxID=7222 RepID=UPI0013EEFD5B|nr:protein fem-1 homolog B-like [Drosophila grimshawi]